MMLFAALSISVAACACSQVTAFSGKYESAQFCVNSPNDGAVYLNNVKIATYTKNPYKNANYCAPDKNWSTCYEYCFSYDGKTYFFNL